MIRKHTARSGKVTYYVYLAGPDGARIYAGKRSTKQAAKDLEASKRTTVRKVREGEISGAVLCQHTLTEAFELVKDSLSKRSRATYGEAMRKRVLPRIGSRRIRELRRPDVEALRDDLLEDYSPATVTTTLGIVSATLSECVRRELLERNPCRGVKAPKNPLRGHYRWLKTTADIEAMLRNASDELRPLLAFLVLSGCRVGEACHLRWEDVDLDRRLIFVHRGRQGTTKSGKPRHVPILDGLVPVLRDMLPEVGKATGLVFPGRGGAVRELTAIRTGLTRALAAAKLDRVRVHDLRHTFASHWVAGGGDLFKLSKVLGHGTIRMTEVYAHLAPSAFESDYGRIKVAVPTAKAPAEVVPLQQGTRAVQRRVSDEKDS